MNHNAKQTTKRRRYVHAPKWQAFRNKTWRFWTTRTARPSQVFPEELICSNIPIHRLNPKERNFSKKTPTLKKKIQTSLMSHILTCLALRALSRKGTVASCRQEAKISMAIVFAHASNRGWYEVTRNVKHLEHRFFQDCRIRVGTEN